jgi:hypothetical protein
MPAGHSFEHLTLVLRDRAPARFSGGPPAQDPATAANRSNRAIHSAALGTSVGTVTAGWKTRQTVREQAGLPKLDGIPLLLKIDPSLDLDDLRHFFDFEIVSEQEDGFVIVASGDISLASFQAKLTDFVASIEGSSNVARIHELRDDPNQEERLRRILSETLFNDWPTIAEDADYVVEVGVACVGTWQIPKKPKRGRLKQQTWARKHAEWSRLRQDAYDKWDALRDERMTAVGDIINHYDAEILGNFDDYKAEAPTLPDSFTLRLKLAGKALKDLVLNFAYIFEVAEPDDIETPQQIRRQEAQIAAQLEIVAPAPGAPAVCVVDSGIQEEHLWLEAGIDKASSHCFDPEKATTNIGDYVANGGHGTRVAGAVLHGEELPKEGRIELDAWVQNARVLDDNCALSESMFPPAVIRDVVVHYHKGKRKTRIFNHSINANSPARQRHMSAWAAEIDSLCHDYDILVIQSAGNLSSSRPAPLHGIAEMLANGRRHPAYLTEPACRVSNPAQSLQALTVGSVAYGSFEGTGWRSIAAQVGDSSAFSRSGLGIWDSIKPEVVEFGGDCLVSPGTPPTVGTPDIGRDCYPELVRSTRSGGPAFSRDQVGTSFAAPKVTRVAARLQATLPDASCLLYRALIVQSAQWPEWADALPVDQQAHLLRRIGYGIPNIERAATNTDHRTTFITSAECEISAGDCHVYQVPIPDDLRRPGDDYDIRIEVTLSYVAEPRRTRRRTRGYLSTWLDWVTSRKGELLTTFLNRALKTEEDAVQQGSSFFWTVGTTGANGRLPGVRRGVGTVQKDWTVVKSNQLPRDFCIAVRGHRGWSRDPESAATYAPAVSIEIVGKEIPIYEPLRTAVLELQNEVEVGAEAEVEVES